MQRQVTLITYIHAVYGDSTDGDFGGDLSSKQRNIFEVDTPEDFESISLWDDLQ